MSARPVSELKGVETGEDVWVVGAAASMGHYDPEFFRDRVVVCVNWTFLDFPCSYIVGKELPVEALNASRDGVKFVVSEHSHGTHRKDKTNYDTDKDYWIFQHKDNRQTKVDWSVIGTDKLVVSRSTITSAVHLSAYMGAKSIFLCGVDGGMLDGKMGYDGYNKGSNDNGDKRQKWYRTFVRQSEPQLIEIKKRLQSQYGCTIVGVSPFANFGLEGHKFQP